MSFRLSRQSLVALASVAFGAVMVVQVSANGFERWPVIALDGED